MDYFKTIDAICGAFREFLDKIPFNGVSIGCYEDPYLRNIFPAIQRPCITYGFSRDTDVRADGVSTEGLGMKFQAFFKEESLGEFKIPLIGRHNILNSLGAIAIAEELGIDRGQTKEALATFSGIQRRFEFKGEVHGARIYDDYGHHPTEIRATIVAIKEAIDRRLVILFQPHRYTRTRDLFREFVDAFEGVNVLYLVDIYPAGEPPIDGVSSELLYRELKNKGTDVRYIRNPAELLDNIKGELCQGDLLLTLGAGDIGKVGEKLLGLME
jgi:UDP-N-acetylmuramate--alanine ligase